MEDEMDLCQYDSYWELQRFLDSDEIELNNSWGINEACLGFSNLTSPDGAESSSSGAAAVNKSAAHERNRRKRMNDSIYRLRSIVPRISKMDKASTIKDAIKYVQELQEQERQLEAELADVQSQLGTSGSCSIHNDSNNNHSTHPSNLSPEFWMLPPIEFLELNVKEIGEGNYLVSMTCDQKKGAMSSVCEVLGYLDLQTITSNTTAVSGIIMITLTVQAEELTCSQLREKIESGMLAINELRRTQ